ncbi:hypothetical protein F4604DRAFT_1932340 [Suillus subluteus]|nr:hypothetical protein F4604DRAFT_1932340 [Suillus subluteus]
MVRKLASNGSGRQIGGSRFSQITGRVGDSGGTRDFTQLVVDRSDDSDYAKEQRRVRAAGKRKASEDLDLEDDLSQLTYARPSNMPSHISLGAPVTHKTAKDLTPTFLVDAKVEVKRPNFIRWFIATFPYQCGACVTKKVTCEYPPVADGVQRRFTCTACRDDRGVTCSWLQDLLEVYIREAYRLDVGEARVLASSKGNDPQGTLSSYYQTWLAEPAGRCSDGELRERLKALETIISSERPQSSSRASPAQHDSLQSISAQRASTQLPPPEVKPKPQKRVKLIAALPQEQLPPVQAFLPPAESPSTPASVQISPGGSQLPPTIPGRASPPPLPLSRSPPPTTPYQASPSPPPSTPAPVHISSGRSLLLPTTPDRLPAGCTPLSSLLPISPGPRQSPAPLANSALIPANCSPPTIAPAIIATSETHSNIPQIHSPAQMDDLHTAYQLHSGDNLSNTVLDTIPNGVDAGTDEAFASADPRPPSCDIVRLKSDMANLSDELAKLAVGDPSFQPEFSNRQEAESYLLKTLQGSLQTCDFLRSVVDEQDSRHIAVTRLLEGRIHLLTLENGQLRQGVAAKCLERKIFLLEVGNDRLRGRLARQDQELEDGRLQGMAVKSLEQKVRQLEVEKEKLQEKFAQREQEIATMKARTQLADCVLRLTSRHGLLAPGDIHSPDPVADTNLRGFVSMIHAYLDSVQPALANQRLGGLDQDGRHQILSE